jgi:predicted dehydrogenase
VVVDLTIPDAHAEVACLALGKGCHVLAEKPLAASMADARRILAAASRAGKTHAVMQNRRYLPQMLRFRDAIRSRIGTPAELHADFFIGAHFGGFRDAMRHVLILDMAIHTFDQARFLTGMAPVAVNALEWNPAGSWYRHGASALVCVEMANGLRFTYRGSWCAEGANTSWEAQWRAIGSGGTATWDGGQSVRIAAVRPWQSGQFHTEPYPVEDAPPAPTLLHEAHAGCIDEMLKAIAAGIQPQTTGGDNIHSLAMVHAAIASAEQGGARVVI